MKNIKLNPVHKRAFVVAFVFRETPGSRAPDVFLVKKNPRREAMMWQRGLWNGVGGAVEPGETPSVAIDREWGEEVGGTYFFTLKSRLIAVEEGRDYVLHCFSGRADDVAATYQWPEFNDADEQMAWLSMADMDKYQVLGNLRWMLPLALDPRSIDPIYVVPNTDISRRPTWGYHNERR